MNNAGFLSTFAPALGIWKCGKPLRVYHIPTCLFLSYKLVRLYAARARKNMCRLTKQIKSIFVPFKRSNEITDITYY